MQLRALRCVSHLSAKSNSLYEACNAFSLVTLENLSRIPFSVLQKGKSFVSKNSINLICEFRISFDYHKAAYSSVLRPEMNLFVDAILS